MGKMEKNFEKDHKRKKILFVPWTAVVLWMVLIFYLSHQPAAVSNEISTGVTEIVIRTVEKIAPQQAAEFDIRRLNHLIRKNAHFLSYLVLGVLVLNALRRSGMYGMKGVRLAFIICVLYAISDEVHQMYVLGRSSEVMDVIIDSVGAATGILGYLAMGRVIKRD